MMQMAKVVIAVANAIDPIKNVAQDITATNDEDGVARWLERNFG